MTAGQPLTPELHRNGLRNEIFTPIFKMYENNIVLITTGIPEILKFTNSQIHHYFRLIVDWRAIRPKTSWSFRH